MNIGDRIRLKRNEKGWSQRDLAAKMGYSNHSTVGKIETGKVDLPQSKVVQFAEVLGVTVAYLMGWEEEIKKAPEEMAERHFQIITDADISEIFDDFKLLDEAQRKIVKDLVKNLAATKKTEA